MLLELQRGFRHLRLRDGENLAGDLRDDDVVVTCTKPLDRVTAASLRSLGFEIVRLDQTIERDGSFRPLGPVAADILARRFSSSGSSCRPARRVVPASSCLKRAR